ncbi:hypothetical protein ACS0TY_004775 [Phlomoides rotata]
MLNVYLPKDVYLPMLEVSALARYNISNSIGLAYYRPVDSQLRLVTLSFRRSAIDLCLCKLFIEKVLEIWLEVFIQSFFFLLKLVIFFYGADIFKVFSWLWKNKLDTSILDIQVAIVKHHTSSSSKEEENDDPAHVDSMEETLQHILMYKKFAAALLCKMTNVVGTVAALGKVDDANLSSFYISRQVEEEKDGTEGYAVDEGDQGDKVVVGTTKR